MEEDRFTRLTLRLPKDLYSVVEQSAEASGRSVNGEIVERLGSSFVESLNERYIEAIKGRADAVERVIELERVITSLLARHVLQLGDALRGAGAHLSREAREDPAFVVANETAISAMSVARHFLLTHGSPGENIGHLLTHTTMDEVSLYEGKAVPKAVPPLVRELEGGGGKAEEAGTPAAPRRPRVRLEGDALADTPVPSRPNSVATRRKLRGKD